MSELTVRDGNHLPSKAVLGSYVHDAAEMEFELYTLTESKKQLDQIIEKEKRRDAKKEVAPPNIAPLLQKKAIQDLFDVEKEVDRRYAEGYKKASESEGAGIFGEIWLSGGILACIALAIWFWASFVHSFWGFIGYTLLALLVFCVVFFAPAAFVMFKSMDKAEAKIKGEIRPKVQSERDRISRQNEEAERFNRELPSKNKAIEEANKKAQQEYEDKVRQAVADHQKKLELLCKQQSELNSKLIKIRVQRERFYSPAIIPMDYRTIECVFFLDHSFRNDLVDTVRQGIERYELSEYRNAVLGGLQTIASSLGNLTGVMLDLGNRINSIQNQVSVMSNDLYHMTERQAKMQSEMDDNNRRVLEESRLQRYATESLNRNAEKIVKYCETGSTY